VPELRNLAGDTMAPSSAPSSDSDGAADDLANDHDDHGPAAIPGSIPTMAGMDDD